MAAIAGRLDQPLPVGNEGAGIVVAAGSSAAAQALLGKTVALVGGAMYAQYRTTNAEDCLVLPEDATAADGASCFINPLTALGMVETMRREGHTALVHTAAASNLGQMLNRICLKDKIGLVNIVRSAAQEEMLRAQGARYVCNSAAPSFKDDLTQRAGGHRRDPGLRRDGRRHARGADSLLHGGRHQSTRRATYSRYGSAIHKQVYIYGGLDTRPTEFSRSFGMAYGIGGWLVFPFLNKIGPADTQKLKDRVAAELKTTFASHYAAGDFAARGASARHDRRLQQTRDRREVSDQSKQALKSMSSDSTQRLAARDGSPAYTPQLRRFPGLICKERPMGSKRPDRREFLKSGAALAGGFTLGAAAPALGQEPMTHASPPMIKGDKDGQIAYGDRSKYVTSVRIPHGGRPSPDNFGLTFHVATPLQDSVGVITPSSLHYFATTRGAFLPDIDPREHRFMIHGLVDRPLTFTMEDLKRLPSVTRLHFIECAGNRSSRRAKTVQETHGMTSCAEWTGVLLSTLLKECGLKGGAILVRRRRGGGSEGRVEHADRQGDGRLHRGLRHERRGRAASERISAAADGPRLRGNLSHQVAAANQGRRSVLHELQRLRASSIRTRKRKMRH